MLLVILIAALAAGGWWGYSWWTEGRFLESTDDAYIQADQVEVSPKVTGYVDQVLVQDNADVKAGDVLVKIDASDYQAALEQAQAQKTSAEADLVRSQAEHDRSETMVDQAEAQVESAQSKADFAQSQVDRYAPLVKTGAATAEQMAQMTSTRDESAAQVKVAQTQLASSKAAVATAEAAIGQAKAGVVQAEAQLRRAQLDIDHTTVRAAIDGKIGDRSVQKGQLVQNGTQLMTIVPMTDLYLAANFKETQLADMKVGQDVTLEVDALPGQELHGKIESFSPGTGARFALLGSQNATGNFTKIVQRVPVRISIKTSPEVMARLIPGMSVTATVDTRTGDAQ
ncbi:HlyD family efflux transporter periplasmic adaptor subunit [Pseudooceanicola sp. GBMRC 2024]|uniref:HlyD family efflux transporter periplasmic adaptor subunit n=1 Tax=Pseudooceanicola albus TaxID=2692189 RepID=A0A6L7G3J4_9RHOB|nr:HlyD family efflux transporter periplasmic adaptor subunit [Pseudooceanicola albus]